MRIRRCIVLGTAVVAACVLVFVSACPLESDRDLVKAHKMISVVRTRIREHYESTGKWPSDEGELVERPPALPQFRLVGVVTFTNTSAATYEIYIAHDVIETVISLPTKER